MGLNEINHASIDLLSPFTQRQFLTIIFDKKGRTWLLYGV